MKNIKNVVNLFFGEITWLMGLAGVLSISTYITIILFNSLIPHFHIVAVVTICSFAFINAYILVAGVLFRIFVRPLKEGRYKVNSKRHMMWRLNWNFYSYVFLFLRQYLFYNKTIRFLFFRLLRVNLHYSTYFAETVDMQDANNFLYFGKNAAIGSEVLLSTHLALDAHIHILKKLIIGENTQIQARSCLAPGAKIGSNVIIGFENRISVDVVIGDSTRTGVNCIFHYGAKIGQNCRIGHGVIVDEYCVIPDNTNIDDFAHVQKSSPTSSRKIRAILPDTILENIVGAPAEPLLALE
jgi:carbonic anhydrase/acetyltransferase-like protein (isoleucine patch superfamily)